MTTTIAPPPRTRDNLVFVKGPCFSVDSANTENLASVSPSGVVRIFDDIAGYYVPANGLSVLTPAKIEAIRTASHYSTVDIRKL